MPFLGAAGQHQFDAQGFGPGLDHFNGLRVAIGVHHHHHATCLDLALGQGHGLCSRGGFIEHGGIGHGHGGQITDHGLKVQQGFHAALADFGLVWGVRGVPSGVFQNIAQDHAGGVGAVVTLANKAFEQFVLARHGFEFCQCRRFGDGGGQLHALAPSDGARHDGLDQGSARGRANHPQHVLFIRGTDANVAGNELRMVFQFVQGFGGGHEHGEAFGWQGSGTRGLGMVQGERQRKKFSRPVVDY